MDGHGTLRGAFRSSGARQFSSDRSSSPKSRQRTSKTGWRQPSPPVATGRTTNLPSRAYSILPTTSPSRREVPRRGRAREHDRRHREHDHFRAARRGPGSYKNEMAKFRHPKNPEREPAVIVSPDILEVLCLRDGGSGDAGLRARCFHLCVIFAVHSRMVDDSERLEVAPVGRCGHLANRYKYPTQCRSETIR